MLIQQALTHGRQLLSAIEIASPAAEARLLLAYALKYSQEELLRNVQNELPEELMVNYLYLLERRIKLEPIAYILGIKEFYGREFFVSKEVLIPRSDSETLIDALLNYYPLNSSINILELGVGSGCLILTLLAELPEAKGVAVDIAEQSILCAARNAKKLGLTEKIEFLVSDWFSKVPQQLFNVIIANPPYISEAEHAIMALETLKYEPHRALFAREDGLEDYQKIASQAASYLAPNGKIFLEIAPHRKQEVSTIFTQAGFALHSIYYDLQNHPRVLVFQ